MQLLHESERTRVTRVPGPAGSGTYIRKEPLGPDREKRLRHETAILQRLAGVEGIAQLADVPPDPESIVLTDVDGESLTSRLTPLAVPRLLALALDLARAVAGMHRRGVVHRDISPANIVLAGHRDTPILIDFGLATTLGEIRPVFAHQNEIVGTLAYLAPEQTGRTGRPVDQRADLYALGATLYELATGAPPFRTDDPLRLTHDHLARLPVRPDHVNPALPADLAEVIMRLLAKEPDNRYQGAEGLIHDLVVLRDPQARRAMPWRPGEHDFPLRLVPPSHLVGRDAEIAAVSAAFQDTMEGRARGLLVTGRPGVGKTSLIDELRPIVTANDGWFVAGKFDQYRHDREFDGLRQAFRDLGRLLLAEPEDELADVRRRMLDGLGPNAGHVTAVIPELGVLLGVPPDPGDLLTAEVRAQRNAVAILRAVASRKRPIVFVVDDLQWAGRTQLGFMDTVWGGEAIEGVMLVGAYREDAFDLTHPLSPLLTHWADVPGGPVLLRLRGLSPPSLTTMVGDMLHLDEGPAGELAAAIGPTTGDNPFNIVELLNRLRQDGVVRAGDDGWVWNQATLSRYLSRADVAETLGARTEAVPAATRDLLSAMACLGGRAEVSLLQSATGLSTATVDHDVAPALDEGLLVTEPGGQEAVRFRHDRIRELVLRQLAPSRQRALRLRMARRLAAAPDLFAIAAEQYLPVVDEVRDPDERRLVVELLRLTAKRESVLANHVAVADLLAAAISLTDPADTVTARALLTDRHAALYSLGRLDEADEVYATVDRLCETPLEENDATLVQVSSLTNRRRHQEAIALGLRQLSRLGLAVPTPQRMSAEIERGLDRLYRWVDESDDVDDRRRPEIIDPTLLARAALINRIMPAAFFSERAPMAWLILEAVRMWAEHGPGRPLVGPVAHAMHVTIELRDDYRTGHRVLRRILAAGEDRRYEPDTSQARFLYAVTTCHWFEPLEHAIRQAQRAREGLILGGDLQNACFTYYVSVLFSFDCAPALDGYLLEVESGLAFARRIGNDQAADSIGMYGRLARVLGGEPEARLDERASAEALSGNRYAAAHSHLTRAIAAAILGGPAELIRHTTQVMSMLDAILPTYPGAVAHTLHALALADESRADEARADESRAAAPGTGDQPRTGLDVARDWLAERAEDSPDNFRHLLRLVEAERAWARADVRAAMRAFDDAQREVGARQRPWHRALILERSARFYLANGAERAGRSLLSEARQEYLAWGAVAKVEQLDRAYPSLRTPPEVHPARDGDRAIAASRSSIGTGAIDLLGVLAGSQALSSETTIDGLRSRVVEVLSAMTGATDVHLLLWNDEAHTWLLSTSDGGASGTISIDQAGSRRRAPLSAIRYAERTREPLVVSDATSDGRFARDPYFADLDRCSLLAVPIFNRGALQALLVLENRLIRGAFSADRLDAVMLIARQLAVSLDNSTVYQSLERKVAERTEELLLAKNRLELLSITDPLTGVANRRQLEDALGIAWRRAQNQQTPISLAIVDVDHFKLYNDHYGHPAGDECLQHIAAQLSYGSPEPDLVARYGGEEFAIVMPNTDIDAAARRAEHLRAAVESQAQPHALAPEHVVTVSIGVATVAAPKSTTVDHLVDTADNELYRAKRSGRNRVKATVLR